MLQNLTVACEKQHMCLFEHKQVSPWTLVVDTHGLKKGRVLTDFAVLIIAKYASSMKNESLVIQLLDEMELSSRSVSTTVSQ